MNVWLSALLVFGIGEGKAAGPSKLETRFDQVAPTPSAPHLMERSHTRKRAALLIHGIKLHPLSASAVLQATMHPWQESKSTFVSTLAKDSDVYSFAYGQNVDLEAIAQSSALASAVRKLKFLGYSDIVLVGHSAGGLIARMLVEDQPDLGVTRVVQICCPNGGSTLASMSIAVRKEQEAFLKSLTRDERLKCLAKRAEKQIPPHIEFACVVGAWTDQSDGLVACQSQWTEDLQRQGIPAYRLQCTHWTVVRTPKLAEQIADLVKSPHPRLDSNQIRALKKSVLPEAK